MKAKRLRFKDSETEPNHPASCSFGPFGDSSAACEAREDRPKPPAASSSEPKTSEFMFFKKLKQDVGSSYCRNSQKRKSLPVRNVGPGNHSGDLGDLKFKDVKSSQSVKKPVTTDEIGSFLSPKDAALESSATPMPDREHDTGWFKGSSLVKTPCINLDTFFCTTANGSENTGSQQRDGDIFSSKRQKLVQQIAKTLFPDAGEVPKECNLVLLLLRRLIPESSQETLFQNKLRQPETKEKCQLHLDSNIQLKEALNSRKLRKANDDHFLDRNVPAGQSWRFLEPPPSCQTLEDNDSSAANYSYRMLGHKEGNGQGSSPNGIGYECWSNRFEDRNLLTLGNELHDYSTAGSNSPNIFKNKAYEQFPYDVHDSNWSCRARDSSILYKFLDRSYDSFAAAKSSSLVYKDEIHDFEMDTGAQSSPDTWCGSSSHVYLERVRPFAFSCLRDYTEPNCLNGFKIRAEPCPHIIGWNTDESNVHDSTQTTNMEIEIYHPPVTYLQDNPELETYNPQSSTWSGNDLVSPENRNLLHSLPYPYQDHDTQEQHLQRNDLVPTSPCIPLKLLYGPEQFNSNGSGLSFSRGSSFFYIPQNGSWSICERNCSAREAFSWPESDYGLKCKSITGSLNEQYDTCTDNSVDLFSPEHSKSQFLIEDENDHSISHQDHRSMTSVHVPLDQEDLYPLQLHTLMWKDTEDETCDYDRGTISTSDSLFW